MRLKSVFSAICLSLSLSHLPSAAADSATCSDMPAVFTVLREKQPALPTAQQEAEDVTDVRDRTLAFLLLAEKYLDAHQDEQAKKALEESLKNTGIEPIEFGFTARYVRALIQLKQYDQALALLLRAPNKAELEESRLVMSGGYLREGKLDEAYEILKAQPAGVAQLSDDQDPVSLQLLDLAGQALKKDYPRFVTFALNSIHDPYDRALAHLELAHYYTARGDEKASKRCLDRAYDEAKAAPAFLVPYSQGGKLADRSSAVLLAQIAGELTSTDSVKARAALQAALLDAQHEFETAKYTNGKPVRQTAQSLEAIAAKAHAKPLPKTAQFQPHVLGLHPSILKDARTADQVRSLLEGNDSASALNAARLIEQRGERSKLGFEVASAALKAKNVDVAMKALDLAIEADPSARSSRLTDCVSILILCHQPERACRMLRFARADSEYSDGLRAMAEAYCANGDLAESLEIFRSISDPKKETLYAIAGKALELHKLDTAAQAISYLNTPLDKAIAFRYFANEMVKANRVEDARAMLDQALDQAHQTKGRIVPLDKSLYSYESTARLLGNIAVEYKEIDRAKAENIWREAKSIAQSGEEKVCKRVYGLSPLVEKLKTLSELDVQAREIGIPQSTKYEPVRPD